MEEMKESAYLEEFAHEHDGEEINIYQPESRFARYIPGGYSESRCLKLTGRPMLYAILAVAGTAIMFFGYDASVMSQVNTNEDYLRLMGAANGTDRDSAAIGGIVSVWFGGFAIGALLVGTYADGIGRLRTIQLGCLWGIFGAALQASAQNITWMCFARVIGGIGCGHLNTVVPIWTSEIADADMRGAFVAVEFTLALVGSTIVYWMEFGCVKTTSEAFAWRFPVGFQCIFLLLIMVAVPFFPESPRHLMKIGQTDLAEKVMRRCRIRVDDERIAAELRGIKLALRLEATSPHTYWSMLFSRNDRFHTRRRILLGGGVQVMQKLTGIDFIATYAPEMFSLAGYAGDKPALLAGGNFISYTASLACAIYLADHFGRRKLMITGCFGMGVVLIVGSILSHEVIASSNNPSRQNSFGGGVAAILYLYTFIYGSCWLTTCWVYPTEIFPLATRAKGAALATVAFSLAGGFINEIIPYLITAVSFWVFVLFALINFAMLVPIYLFYIETANRTLEDFDFLFSSRSILNWKAEREYKAYRESQARETEEENLNPVEEAKE